MGRIVVLISGSGSNLQALIDGVAQNRIKGQIVSVISNRSTAFGLERAAAAHIPTHTLSFAPFKARGEDRIHYDKALGDLVHEATPDLIVLAGWMRILTQSFVKRFSDRLINLHPALPGEFPGKDAIERAWQAAQRGELARTGVMVHRVIEEVDAGAVLGVQALPIHEHDSLTTLTDRIHDVEHRLLVQVVAELLAPQTKTPTH